MGSVVHLYLSLNFRSRDGKLQQVAPPVFNMLSISCYVLLLPFAIVTIYVLSILLLLVVRQTLTPLRGLHGPASSSIFYGNLREMHDQENNDLVARWEAEYGSTFVYHGFIGGPRLMTTDPVAVNYIMSRGYDFPKPDFVNRKLARMAVGKEGLLTVEGEVHRRQVSGIIMYIGMVSLTLRLNTTAEDSCESTLCEVRSCMHTHTSDRVQEYDDVQQSRRSHRYVRATNENFS